MAEPINLSFGLWTRVGWRKHKFNRIRQVGQCALPCGHIGASWRIRLNRPSAVAMRSCQIPLTTCLWMLSIAQRLSTCYWYFIMLLAFIFDIICSRSIENGSSCYDVRLCRAVKVGRSSDCLSSSRQSRRQRRWRTRWHDVGQSHGQRHRRDDDAPAGDDHSHGDVSTHCLLAWSLSSDVESIVWPAQRFSLQSNL